MIPVQTSSTYFLHVLWIDRKLLPRTWTLPFFAPCNTMESNTSSFPSLTIKWLSTLQFTLHCPLKSHLIVFDGPRKVLSRINGSFVSHSSGPSSVNGQRYAVLDDDDKTWCRVDKVFGSKLLQTIPCTNKTVDGWIMTRTKVQNVYMKGKAWRVWTCVFILRRWWWYLWRWVDLIDEDDVLLCWQSFIWVLCCNWHMILVQGCQETSLQKTLVPLWIMNE